MSNPRISNPVAGIFAFAALPALVLLLLGLSVQSARAATVAGQGLDISEETLSFAAQDNVSNLEQPVYGKVRGRASMRPQVVVNDTFSFTLPSLPAGERISVTFEALIDNPVTPGTTQVRNQGRVSGANFVATFTDDPATGALDDPTFTALDLNADLTITKTDSSDPVLAGSLLTYTFTVTNNGPDTAIMVITDTLPAGVTYVSDSCGGSNTTPWVANLGSFSMGGSHVCSLTVNVNPATVGMINNTVTVGSNVDDPDPSNNTEGETTQVVPRLVINEINYDQPALDRGEFIEIKNVSPNAVNLDAFDLKLVDGFTAVPFIYGTIDLPNVILAAGDYYVICADSTFMLNCDLDVSPDVNLIENGSPNPDAVALVLGSFLLDTVSYEGDVAPPYTEGSGVGLEDGPQLGMGISRLPDGFDSNQNNLDFSQRCISPGTANIAATINCAPVMVIEKVVTPLSALPGQTITYTLHFSNSTDGALFSPGVVVSDSLPVTVSAISVISSGVAITQSSGAPNFVWDVGSLPARASGIITVTAVVNANLVADETITNSAYITSTFFGGDNDAAAFDVLVPRVAFESAAYLVGENDGTALITVTLDVPNPYANVTVNYLSSAGSASDGSDYNNVSGSVTILAGRTAVTFTVPILDENVVENDETVNLVLSSPLGAALGTQDEATLTIDNDDSTALSIDNGTQAEGNAGNRVYTFTITLSAPVAEEVTVAVNTADDTATVADGDYSALSGQMLTFSPGGALSKTVIVNVAGDLTVEDNERFLVNLSDARFDGTTDATKVAILDGQGEGAITNDDSASFSIGDVTQNEGDSGTTAFQFTLSLSAPTGKPISVTVNTADGTATTADADYSAITNQSVTFAAGGALSQTVTVNVNGDIKVENDETFFVNLSDARFDGATDATRVTILDGQGVGTISNDDSATVAVSSVSDLEANGPFVFEVTLSRPVDAEVTVDFSTTDGTATVGDNDYTAVTGRTVTFTIGTTTTQVVAVTVLDDPTLERNETFTVTLDNLAANGRNVSLNSEGTGTILNDEPRPNNNILDATAAEDSDFLTFTVVITQLSALDTEVDFATVDGTAQAGQDYTAISGTLTIPAGKVAGAIGVPIINDALDENVETLSVILTNAVNAELVDRDGLGTITDDDAPPQLNINDASAAEDAGLITFTVTLTAVSGLDVAVNFATSDGSAIAADDYPQNSGTLVISAGITSALIQLPLVNDLLDEGDETFFVNLSGESNATLADGQAVGTIQDNDQAGISVSKVASADTANVGDTITYTYRITNSGNILLEGIEGVDNLLGQLTLPDTTLTAGSGMTAILTTSVELDDLPGPLLNTVTVNGTAGGVAVQAIDQATVEVVHASFLMSKTVGIEGIEPTCTTNTILKVPKNTTVAYCYTIHNTGALPLTNHTLIDSHLGVLLSGLDVEVTPDSIYTHTMTATVTVDTTNVATWTATAEGEAAELLIAQAGDVTVATLGEATVIISADTDDADGDTIPDNTEGAEDPDGDNIPNFQDPDSDDDGESDEEEVGPDPNNPVDSDDDGIPDYLDTDPTALDPDQQPRQPARIFLPHLSD